MTSIIISGYCDTHTPEAHSDALQSMWSVLCIPYIHYQLTGLCHRHTSILGAHRRHPFFNFHTSSNIIAMKHSNSENIIAGDIAFIREDFFNWDTTSKRHVQSSLCLPVQRTAYFLLFPSTTCDIPPHPFFKAIPSESWFAAPIELVPISSPSMPPDHPLEKRQKLHHALLRYITVSYLLSSEIRQLEQRITLPLQCTPWNIFKPRYVKVNALLTHHYWNVQSNPKRCCRCSKSMRQKTSFPKEKKQKKKQKGKPGWTEMERKTEKQ